MSAPENHSEKPARNSHCGSCGAPYAAAVTWPRTCTACGTTAYRNPLPVAVALLPVTGRHGTGLVVITRTIPPHRGGLALPGGYIDHDEDWKHAVVRELGEETGIGADAREVRLADALSAPDGHLLLFGLLPERAAAALPLSRPTDETSGFRLLREPTELAFPLHTHAVRTWFDGGYR
ncbi:MULTISPECIES: NUDIX domain-containing protein [unclassified Streptomyces]|uniref:NUDIX domain-containing protein n=1 Tax=unclassified Streptomyces TaxID=2593676 RepID=UPI00081B36BF|nr:NUDIX domain-containing protein [Streptomyces sp. DvalAA-43]MYQ83192.1 NUDIX domain-containing protein [Streptomyces sp. SID4936]SCD61954.1 ADP-ribose pyrophosphatase YjhB, NUDIX family [Streptomyces sp. DvalAA-43]